MNDVKFVKIPLNTMQDVVNVLSNLPWNQVNELLNRVKSEVIDIPSDAELEYDESNHRPAS